MGLGADSPWSAGRVLVQESGNVGVFVFLFLILTQGY